MDPPKIIRCALGLASPGTERPCLVLEMRGWIRQIFNTFSEIKAPQNSHQGCTDAKIFFIWCWKMKRWRQTEDRHPSQHLIESGRFHAVLAFYICHTLRQTWHRVDACLSESSPKVSLMTNFNFLKASIYLSEKTPRGINVDDMNAVVRQVDPMVNLWAALNLTR